jgi:thioredoxin 1
MAKFSELINSDIPVLVDFYAEWCGPCKMMPPVLQEVASKMGNKVRILKVDIDKNAAAATKFGISSVPTLMVFKKGKIRWQQSGVIDANRLSAILQGFI